MFGMNDPFGFNNHINSMMNGFMMDPFAPPQQQQQQRGNHQNSRNQNNNRNQNFNDPFNMMMMSPFDRHNSMMAQHQNNNPFALMNQMMSSMRQPNFSPNIINADPNSQVFSSSSVITYSNSGDGKPKVYQESSQMRQGPGGIKETRKMVRDSEKGIEKMAVGHHIGDRAHIIERQKYRDGNLEEVVNLENLDDEEVPEFNKEFEDKLLRSHHNAHNTHRSHHLNTNQPFAIEDGHSHRRQQREKEKKAKSSKSKH